MSARHELIDAEKATVTAAGAVKYSIVKMCEWLEVSSSGYYEWRDRSTSVAVIDCHTKAVIGWATGDNYRTPLISAAIRMAARNQGIAPGAIFHSDRGSNYTSTEFAEVLNGLGIRQSVGRTGICYDNALAESFFAALKTERVHRTQYPTREHLLHLAVGRLLLPP